MKISVSYRLYGEDDALSEPIYVNSLEEGQSIVENQSIKELEDKYQQDICFELVQEIELSSYTIETVLTYDGKWFEA